MLCGSYSNSFIASSLKTSTIKMSLGRQRLKLRRELHHPTGLGASRRCVGLIASHQSTLSGKAAWKAFV